ncbi:MAG: hypothetical protein VR71_10650 [Roseovarius sp. BRH_c41]|uniref:DUF2730 family protein n=1 Tax=Roseovarius sp. BRH_c41 TaxID=1629709 RepID=UPI0005F18B61|nr:DUF2730 family protein [Roseovarius sp. BRH_c41]KJS43366.1 MAG: hypothetical protein VR71_10650 [Roseovarius sp. BRH_c41]
MMDWDLFWKASGVILPVIVAIYTFIATRRKDLDQRLEAGHERMDRHEARISRLEQSVQNMPGKDDMHSLQLELVRQTGSMEKMAAVMEGNAMITARLEAIVSRHEQHLLNGGKT